MTYVVNVINQGHSWYLRGTTWTGEPERASRFPSAQAALAGLQTAKRFVQPRLFKIATIEEVDPVTGLTFAEGRARAQALREGRFANADHEATVQAMINVVRINPVGTGS